MFSYSIIENIHILRFTKKQSVTEDVWYWESIVFSTIYFIKILLHVA